MPPLSTHLRFATYVLPSLGITYNVGAFALGTTAPDAFEPESEESFSQHHFKGENGLIHLPRFLECTHFRFDAEDNPIWSFSCGYYTHLWLDVFYRDHTDQLPFKRPVGISVTDLRKLVRRESEILNAPLVLSFENPPVSPLTDLPLGLEFVNVRRCIGLFNEVVKQSRRWSEMVSTFETLDRIEYGLFFDDLSKRLAEEFQAST